jgi:hypothetical protein
MGRKNHLAKSDPFWINLNPFDAESGMGEQRDPGWSFRQGRVSRTGQWMACHCQYEQAKKCGYVQISVKAGNNDQP